MKLVELVFQRADGTKFSVPCDEARTLQDLLAHMPDISQPKEEELQKTASDPLKELAEYVKKVAEEREKQKRRNIPMPPNWPLVPPWTPGHPTWLDFHRATCEQQPLRFGWDGITEGDSVKISATQPTKFHIQRSA